METPRYEDHNNICVDLVKYVRSNTIRNEQQFLLLCLAYSSGLAADTNHYVSSVCIGTSSSGKSHLKDKVDDVFAKLRIMDASTGSEKALIYDDEWDEADIISMGELQQPPEEMIEFLKRAHGGDEEVVIRSTRGNPSEGFETETIRKKAKAYHFTYAQFDADFEFWNRLLKIPVHESESKNRAVGKMVAGHDGIQLGDTDNQYGYDFGDGLERLQDRILEVKQHAPKRTVMPIELGADFDPWEVLEPIFNHSRSESNRVYSMLFNLIRSSAILNYRDRDIATIDDDEYVVVGAQDVANLIACLSVLRSTTHEIDRKKRAIVEAIRAKSGPDDAIEGVEPIREFCKESDAPEVKKDELENILEDLQQNFLIDIQRDAGEGGKNVYRAFKWDQLGRPRVDAYAEHFEDCVDPITGEDFLDSWSERSSDLETTAQDLLKTAEVESKDRIGSRGSTTTSDSSGSQNNSSSSLSSFSGDDSTVDPDLEVWVEALANRIEPVIDGRRIERLDDVPVEAFVGLVELNDADASVATTDSTVLDPDHHIWDVEDKDDSWVSTENDARRQIQTAIERLIANDVIDFETVHEREDGEPIDATITVNW